MGKIADELRERSKRDDALIVGSEIRAALGDLDAEIVLLTDRNAKLEAVYEAASQINRENTYLTINPDMSDLNAAIAAVQTTVHPGDLLK